VTVADSAVTPIAASRIVWRNGELKPIGPPLAIGRVVVGIVSTPHHELRLVGIDPSLGEPLWQQALTPSSIAPGMAIEVVKLGEDAVAYFRPVDAHLFVAQLIVANAATGEDIASSPAATFNSLPFACNGQRDVCTTARAEPGVRSKPFRLEVATGEYLQESDGVPPGARVLGVPGLLDLGDRPGNTLGLLRDGQLVWTLPISAAFPPGFSSDNGWRWEFFPKTGAYVGSVAGPSITSGAMWTRDLSSTAIAALDAASGEVLWRDNGSKMACYFIQGQPVRCRLRGKMTGRYGEPASYQDLDVIVEGFEVATGETTWSFHAGAAQNLMNLLAPLPIAGATKIVLSDSNGPVVLDYSNGVTQRPPPTSTFWCVARTLYEYAQGYEAPTGSTIFRRPGGGLAEICDAHGRRATALPSLEATAAVGARVGDVVVVATKDGYIGIDVAD
jgi:hypothetical protein